MRFMPFGRKEARQEYCGAVSFSPFTYKNPCIPYMHELLDVLLMSKGLPFKDLELVVIDAAQPEEPEELFVREDALERAFYAPEHTHFPDRGPVGRAYQPGWAGETHDAWTTHDDRDIEMTLTFLAPRLNYLMLVTDRPVYYKEFVHTMYEEYGLIVQRMPKTARLRARGNLILDFERGADLDKGSAGRQDAWYIPVYKKRWEIGENLDITVPVGYNTLVITGAGFLPADRVCLSDGRSPSLL